MECCTDFKTDEIEMKWVIKRISSIFNRIRNDTLPRDALKSKEFSTVISHKNQWHLQLDLNNTSGKWKYDIDLRLLTNMPVTIEVKYYLLNSQNLKTLVSESKAMKLQNNGRYSTDFSIFFSGEKFLINDTLTLFCYLKEYGDLFTYNKLPQMLNVFANEDLSNDLKNLLISEENTDITLVMNDEIECKAHKNILSSRSPVFAAMFSHPDMHENQTNRVNIKDTNSTAMTTFLEFLYTGKIEVIGEEQLDLYVLSDKYGVNSLKQICEEYICNSLSIESVLEVLQVADFSSNENMINAALMFLDNHKDEVSDSADEFENFIKTHPHLIYKLFKKSFKKVEIESKPLE